MLMLLLLSLTTFAQRKQFIRNYSEIGFIDSDGNRSKWYEAESRLFYYYYGYNQIKVFINDDTKLFYFDDESKESSDNNIKYTKFHCIEEKTCEEVFICIFDEMDKGCVILFSNGELLCLR